MRNSGRSLSVSVWVRDQIMRWLDQPFGIAADVQRVVLAAHDLTRNTSVSAGLFRGAGRIYAGGRVNSPRRGPRRIGSGPERVGVPARAGGRTEVAGCNIGGDNTRTGTFHE